MELLRKEMERVGLNNNHDEEQEEGSRNGKKNEQKTMLRTPADIYEHPSFYSFILDMPGLEAQNIKVKVESGILHVTGRKKKNNTNDYEGVKVIRTERRRARYMRKFTLPTDASICNEDVKATYKDGVLSITVAKKPPLVEEQSQPNTQDQLI